MARKTIKIWLFISCAALAVTGCKKADAPSDNGPTAEIPAPRADVVTDRFAKMALECVHREYPNKISHVMDGANDVAAPSELYPAFYGCFDWHSSVHGHWLLTRILKTDPDSPMRDAIIAALDKSFTDENIAGEVAYYTGEDRGSFERPYGIAWYLQLIAELEESDYPKLKEYRETLRPLEDAIVAQTMNWLPKLAYPIRLGTHNQSAFAFGLMIDYARTVGNSDFEQALIAKTREFHEADFDCPLVYEPSGEDFLSPCLMEADLMRRVMQPEEFSKWLYGFLPQIPELPPEQSNADWLEPGVVRDPTDGKLVHLDGVNLSRAWALEGIASVLAEGDPRRASLLAAASKHKETGISAVSDEHYSGSHWLASFATYLETKRGISGKPKMTDMPE